MKDFKEFSKDDQKLICEAMSLHNESMLNAIKGISINTDAEFQNRVESMSYDAKLYMIEVLENSLPEEYK